MPSNLGSFVVPNIQICLGVLAISSLGPSCALVSSIVKEILHMGRIHLLVRLVLEMLGLWHHCLRRDKIWRDEMMFRIPIFLGIALWRRARKSHGEMIVASILRESSENNCLLPSSFFAASLCP